jgi:hypothetical protein
MSYDVELCRMMSNSVVLCRIFFRTMITVNSRQIPVNSRQIPVEFPSNFRRISVSVPQFYRNTGDFYRKNGTLLVLSRKYALFKKLHFLQEDVLFVQAINHKTYNFMKAPLPQSKCLSIRFFSDQRYFIRKCKFLNRSMRQPPIFIFWLKDNRHTFFDVVNVSHQSIRLRSYDRVGLPNQTGRCIFPHRIKSDKSKQGFIGKTDLIFHFIFPFRVQPLPLIKSVGNYQTPLLNHRPISRLFLQRFNFGI